MRYLLSHTCRQILNLTYECTFKNILLVPVLNLVLVRRPYRYGTVGYTCVLLPLESSMSYDS
eukprot:SAG31_NODE_2498_length_5598_cov_2.801600_3_plen_62_part_00